MPARTPFRLPASVALLALALPVAACAGASDGPPTERGTIVLPQAGQDRAAAHASSPGEPSASSTPPSDSTGAPSRGDGTGTGSPSPGVAGPRSSFEVVASEAPCETDADCVPANCCHASACTNRAQAPNCQQVMCTAECRGGTIDCGGGCLCVEGRCAARLVRMTPAQ